VLMTVAANKLVHCTLTVGDWVVLFYVRLIIIIIISGVAGF